MPPVSEAQRGWAWANKDKNTKEGRAAKEFADSDPGGKLPARARRVRRSHGNIKRPYRGLAKRGAVMTNPGDEGDADDGPQVSAEGAPIGSAKAYGPG